MLPLFKKILIPADLTSNTYMAIQKALELIQPDHSAIVLLHSIKPLWSFNLFASTGYLIAPASEILTESEVQHEMDKFVKKIKDAFPRVDIQIIVCSKGKVQENIIRTASEISPDLIIIGKRSNRHYFNFLNLVHPGKIAQKTGCPVLTFKPGSIMGKIKNIVLPVAAIVPERKLDIAVEISKRFNAKVHLVTFPNNISGSVDKGQAFVESFYRIKDAIPLMVRHGPLKGNNLAKAILDYAETIRADLILTNPESESFINTLSGRRHLSDMLLRDSPIQIMDLEPYS